MRDRDKIEILLRNYRPIKSNLEISFHTKHPEYALQSVSVVKTSGDTNNISSEIEKFFEHRDEVEEDLARKYRIVRIIRAAYESLTSLQRRIVKERFFEDKSYKKVSHKVHLHEHTISKRIEEKIIPALKGVGILNAWEIFQKEGEFYQS